MSDPRKPRHGCIAARPTSRYQVTASRYREERQQRQQRIQTRRSHHITSCHTMLHSLVMLNCGFSCCLVQDGELHALLSCCKTIIICLRAMETPGDAASLVTRKIWKQHLKVQSSIFSCVESQEWPCARCSNSGDPSTLHTPCRFIAPLWELRKALVERPGSNIPDGRQSASRSTSKETWKRSWGSWVLWVNHLPLLHTATFANQRSRTHWDAGKCQG